MYNPKTPKSGPKNGPKSAEMLRRRFGPANDVIYVQSIIREDGIMIRYTQCAFLRRRDAWIIDIRNGGEVCVADG